ncbi:MAG: amidohydrolase family protein [Armatimonadetes bacterium]|nr:amidohydrolase family protein [Armatimonadota bacterium]
MPFYSPGQLSATDFNPGSCPCFSLGMIVSLACLKMKLSVEEAINAVTINAAFALGREKNIGSLEIGKKADLIILDLADYQSWPYYFGCNLVKMIIKGGKIWKI